MEQKLSDIITLKRRYTRSINLERDLNLTESVLGYIPTAWSFEATERILSALSTPDAIRAWTITGVYGTGKSAFAHFLASLTAPKSTQIYENAKAILQQYIGTEHPLVTKLTNDLPASGLIRAVATAQREPLSYTIIRALERGWNFFADQNNQPNLLNQKLVHLIEQTHTKQKIQNQEIIDCICSIARDTGNGILLIIDEMGKNLEHAAWHQENDDLYLLQQLAELPTTNNAANIFVLGLLHQSFVEYAQNLTKLQRNEWSKVQGRFEDIPFVATNEHMLHLISQAIEHSPSQEMESFLQRWSISWQDTLNTYGISQGHLNSQTLQNIYPLHPLAALALPTLCNRYAQNDRSLFTFLTSQEPHSFSTYLKEVTLKSNQAQTLKLHRVYDYFIEASNIFNSIRASSQRWSEVQGRISETSHLDEHLVFVLKTIGILNLIDSNGLLKATRQLVCYALAEDPQNNQELQIWDSIIEDLIKRGLIIYRKQLDELRIWEGSDFDIEHNIALALETEQSSLASILSHTYPLTPYIVQKHSYKTGTLRYFERQYIDSFSDLANIKTKDNDSVGVVIYWLNTTLPEKCPPHTINNKPLILLSGSDVNKLDAISREYAALTTIEAHTPQLQSDGVARREVRQRLAQLKHVLNDLLLQSFLSGNKKLQGISRGQRVDILNQKDFQRHLSDLCDQIYPQTPIIRNELINRKEVTSQGAKARRELLEAMLTKSHLERLGLVGNGPETTLYMSLLNKSGIHSYIKNQWIFTEPHEKTMLHAWQAIEQFCLDAHSKPASLDHLYALLEAPPYGMKKGPIPILLLAVLLKHSDDISIYQDGTFIPLLGAEHFELLVKQPSKFSVKYFEIAGLRAQVFKELALMLSGSRTLNTPSSLRNTTILSVVKPLIQFSKNLPSYTVKTKRLSKEAIAIREALRDTREPDELLFTLLPEACGLTPIKRTDDIDEVDFNLFKSILIKSLQELQDTYAHLLDNCKNLIYNVFAVRSDASKIREDLRVRAQYLKDHCIERQMKSFVNAVINDTTNEKEWLEALLMIVADKPAVSWTDDDVPRFEVRLSDLARRFIHLEAIQKEMYQPAPAGFEAQRITITQPDGFEDNHIVWISNDHQNLMNSIVDNALNDERIKDDKQLQQELVALLIKKVFNSNKRQIDQRSSTYGKEA